jgi:hypothetical protein
MAGPILASAGSDWSYGGSILTFLFPMILFLAVAGVLWVLYTKPQQVPGRSYLANERSVAATPTVTAAAAAAGSPGGAGTQPGATAAGASAGGPAASGQADPAAGPAGPGAEAPAAGGAGAGE